MNPIDQLICLFRIEKNLVNDNLMSVNIRANIEFNQLPNYSDIVNTISKFSDRDEVNIYLEDESEENVQISRSRDVNSEYQGFINRNKQLGGIITVKISIDKSDTSDKISIYNIDSFFENFCNHSIIDNLKFLSYRFQKKNQIIFVNYENEYRFNTNSIIMISGDETVLMQENRKERIKLCNEVSTFINSKEFELLPDDFLINSTNFNNNFTERLQVFKIVFSLIYLAEISRLDGDVLKIKLNSYKNKEYLININEFNYKTDYEEFYKIYDWVFQDANVQDKIIIARNMIETYCKGSNILDIDEKTFLSIKSDYKIYLKENVEKYIDLKNKLTEFVINSSNQVNDIIGSFIGNFEKSVVAFMTFFLGTILANIVSENPLDNILTEDIVLIIKLILIGSIGYLMITIIITLVKFGRYTYNYFNLKHSYEDLLNKDDINNIFKADEEYLHNKKSVCCLSAICSLVWIIMIVVGYIIIIN